LSSGSIKERGVNEKIKQPELESRETEIDLRRKKQKTKNNEQVAQTAKKTRIGSALCFEVAGGTCSSRFLLYNHFLFDYGKRIKAVEGPEA